MWQDELLVSELTFHHLGTAPRPALVCGRPGATSKPDMLACVIIKDYHEIIPADGN